MDEHMKRRLDKQKQLFKQLGIQLDALSIHEKQFKNKMRGYDPDEVDAFLDEVIKDYERFYANIADLMDKWQEQQATIRDLKNVPKPAADLNGLDRRQLEDIVKQLEYSVRQLKVRVRPENDYFPE
ncbi:Cell cycle protein GpsB [Paenibacillus polymyxa]|uniref:DivIVA domain-containing protein n=1 Tax=Paenibacillus polymyxa TaxID=1406 RepID=UPI0001E3163D|nr:DivIVA domain-containing protein [Paenibacillus polymyxa]ADM69855.1 cell division protein [Paenibacillus polymyxa E681]APQ59164.1 cell division protein [Paenibacillus polymyxa]QNV56875.1 Cell cycle protein GpsB [Paenibacillus polymyxa E681]QNV61712.1 Cell cycle protein GpsB [Paenibacillus polymyxa E681]VUG03808.1 Cell cycle protein GpsB [Paenibacillus polymyxa]